MKDGFVGQRRFVGHEKKNHSRIIFVCMKYKCQRGLVIQGLLYEDTGLLRSMLLYDNCCGGGSCSCGNEDCGDDGCG